MAFSDFFSKNFKFALLISKSLILNLVDQETVKMSLSVLIYRKSLFEILGVWRWAKPTLSEDFSPPGQVGPKILLGRYNFGRKNMA